MDTSRSLLQSHLQSVKKTFEAIVQSSKMKKELFPATELKGSRSQTVTKGSSLNFKIRQGSLKQKNSGIAPFQTNGSERGEVYVWKDMWSVTDSVVGS